MNGLSPLRRAPGGYAFGLSCPRCGSACDRVTEGVVVGGTQVSAVARCPQCPREWLIVVLLRTSAAKTPARKRRGTRLLPVEP